MSKPLKITLIVLGSLLILGIAGLFIANAVVTSKIEKFLQNGLPETVEVTFEDLKVSSWNGKVLFVSLKIKNIGETTSQTNAQLEMDSLLVAGFGYWDYFRNDKVIVESIQFRQPKMVYNHNPLIDKKDYKYSKLEKLQQDITIHRLNVQNGELTIRNIETDSLLMKTDAFTANVMDIQLNPNTVKRRIPFLFNNYNVHFENLYYQLSDYENLTIESAKVTQDESKFNNLKLFTKYSKQQLTRMIPVERDHFDIQINSVRLRQQGFGYKRDSVFFFKCPKVVFNSPKMDIYRNKLVTDDITVKSLYSKMLRNLNFDLTLSEILLDSATIKYSEQIKEESSAGMISFSKLNAKILNVSNTYSSSEKTTIDIDAIFMKSTPIKVNWNFDVNNVNDHFVFKADVGKLAASDLNSFSAPNLKVKFEGELIRTYFTVDGNFQDSNVDLRTDYEDFKVVVLEKDGKEKNRFLSAVANLFIKKSTDKADDGFREGSKTNIERDKTKSVFNFIWISARSGLMSAMTGDGKK